MSTVIVFSSSTEYLEKLLAYSRLFSLRFFIAADKAELLKHFVGAKPSLFCVGCNDEEQAELKFLRRLSPSTPIIALGDVPPPRNDEAIIVKAFQNGAIDFIRYRCGSREFYYRLTANLRLLDALQKQENASVMHLGDLKIFLKSKQVMREDEFVPLTKSEYDILILLAGNLNQTVPTKKLYQELWSNGELMDSSRAIAMHISRLRHKLHLDDGSPISIATVYRHGYCLKVKPEQERPKP